MNECLQYDNHWPLENNIISEIEKKTWLVSELFF